MDLLCHPMLCVGVASAVCFAVGVLVGWHFRSDAARQQLARQAGDIARAAIAEQERVQRLAVRARRVVGYDVPGRN